MSQNIQIDPVARDYVVVAGTPVPSDRVEEAGYLALTVPQGNWLYGETNQGSLLYQLEGKKRTADIDQRFSAISKEAIEQQVVNAGKATDVGLNNIATSTTGTSNQIGIVPAALPLSSQFAFNSV